MAAKQQPFANEQDLIAQILQFQDDPLAFVMFAFPWGVEGTPLEHAKGPRQWQIRTLTKMRDHIKKNKRRQTDGFDPELCRIARASGRGIGKSAFMSWIAIWMISTIPASTVMISANTEGQLKGTTLPEVKKWVTMSINSHWWETAALSVKPEAWLIDVMKKSTKLDDSYWGIFARLWSEESPDAYAGAHSQRGMMLLFDEASGIPANIFSVAEGFFTDRTVHRFWICISNPRNPSGAFFECFNKHREIWDCENIDAREVKENDQSLYNSIIAQHGIDSDQARVEVLGQFPNTGDNMFMNRQTVTQATQREPIIDRGAPLIMGVDPARFGDDSAVIAFRKGRDARSVPWQTYPKLAITELAEHIITANERYKPDAIFIETDGVGGGLYDLLRHYGLRVTEVKTGGAARDKAQYMNHRVEMWGHMRDWLETGSIPDDDDLITDLCAPEYKFTLKGQLQLEAKADIKKKGYASPDRADALAITFSKKVPRIDGGRSARNIKARKRLATGHNYDIFG